MPFYGGNIIDVVQVKVNVKTGLKGKDEPKEIPGGNLQLMAWKYKDIFVVAIRGTHGKENWAINFQAHALIAEFRPNLESDTTDCQKHKDEDEDHQRELCGDEDGCCIRGRVHRYVGTSLGCYTNCGVED